MQNSVKDFFLQKIFWLKIRLCNYALFKKHKSSIIY